MSHDEFFALTPYEFGELIEGYLVRTEIDDRRRAAQTANLMNCWVKNRITVDRLCPRKHSLSLDRRPRKVGKVVMLDTPEKLKAWQREKGLIK